MLDGEDWTWPEDSALGSSYYVQPRRVAGETPAPVGRA